MASGEWDYWGRVYEDHRLQDKIEAHNRDGPSLAEVVGTERMRQLHNNTRLIVENVPPQVHCNDVKRLIIAAHGPKNVVAGVKVNNQRWLVTLHRSKDVSAVLKQLNGCVVKGHRLTVRHTTIADRWARDKDLVDLDMEATKQQPTRLCTVDNALHQLLQTHLWLDMTDGRVRRLMMTMAEAYQLWPLGVCRMLCRCTLVGRWLCAVENEPQVWQLRGQHSGREVEKWEPCAPADITSRRQLTQYVTAMLAHFGPMWTADPRLQLISAVLPTSAADDWLQLNSLSPAIVVLNDSLYLLTADKHRRAIANFNSSNH